MGDISEHFSRSEFECGCGCGFDNIDMRLVALLERLRAHYNEPITVTSGCRCHDHNAAVGGAASSQHLYGMAADIVVEDVSPSSVARQLGRWLDDRPRVGGVGRYDTFTHVDVRRVRARWDET